MFPARLVLSGGALLALVGVYVASVLVAPLRRFDDIAKLLEAVHEWDDRLRSVGLPSPRVLATAVVAAAAAMLLVAARHAGRRDRLRALAVPLVALAVAEATKVLLPRPARGWEPHYLAAGTYPSAHVAVTSACVLAALAVTPRARRPLLLSGALLAAAMVAVVASAMHRPLDAVGGALLGLAALAAVGPAWGRRPDVVSPMDSGLSLRPWRRAPALAAAGATVVVLAVVLGAAAAPGTLGAPTRSQVDVAFALTVVLSGALAAAIVAITDATGRSRSAASAAASTRSPHMPVGG